MPVKVNLNMLKRSTAKPWRKLSKSAAERPPIKDVPNASSTAPTCMWIKTEREFNRRAGFTNKDDRLPRMFYEEPLPPFNKVVVISDMQMDTTFDF